MSRTLRTILGAVLIGVVAITAILIIDRVFGRAGVDLTEHQNYTLSQGTRNILSSLSTPLAMKLYYSRVAARKGPEGIRFYNNYYLYVRDLLQEYVNLARGKITLAFVDPRPFSDEEEDAMGAGIERIPLPGDEGFFFGLSVRTERGKEKVIPIFEPGRQEFVEYDISKLIANVTRREKRKLGVLSSLPVMGSDMSPYMMQMMQLQGRQPEKPWTFVTHLREEYDVVAVSAEADAIDGDIDFLVVVHPKNLSRKTLFAIDQFVMRGGKLLVFVDPYCVSDRPPRDPRNPYAGLGYDASSNLNALLAKWGVASAPDLIAADRKLALKASMRRGEPPSAILPYLALSDECMNAESVVTAKLHDVTMLFAGVLRPTEGQGATVTPLVLTTQTAGTWQPKGPYELAMLDPAAIRSAVRDGDERLWLACTINGKLATNFPDGLPEEEAKEGREAEASEANGDAGGGTPDDGGETPASPPEETEPDKPAEVLKESPSDAMVIVVADVDCLSDMIAYQESFFGTTQVGDNASLLFNAVDSLSGSGDLIAIRSRGKFSRPFTVVDEIEAEAEKATAAEVAALNEKIDQYQAKLRELGQSAGKTDGKLIQSAALEERKKIQADIRKAQKELRVLQAKRREQIEVLGVAIRTFNMVAAAAVVLLVAIVLGIVRLARAKHYAARRARS